MPTWREFKERARQQRRYFAIGCFIFILSIAFIIWLCMLGSEKVISECKTHECISAARHILEYVDEKADPCDDFYKFACGKYLNTHANGSLIDRLTQIANDNVRKMVTEDMDFATEQNISRSFRNQRSLYTACMDLEGIEIDNGTTFYEVIKNITGGWPMVEKLNISVSWTDIMIKARRQGVTNNFLLNVDVYEDEITHEALLRVGPPPLSNFHKPIWKSPDEVWTNVENFVRLWGNDTGHVQKGMQELSFFIQNFYDIVYMTHQADSEGGLTLDQKKTAITDLPQYENFKLDWLSFLRNLTGLNLKKNDTVVFDLINFDYLNHIQNLIDIRGADILMNFIVLQLISEHCQYLPHESVRTLCIHTMQSNVLNISREDYCFNEALSSFKGIAEAEYSRKLLPNFKRNDIQQMITNIEHVLKENLINSRRYNKPIKTGILAYANSVYSLVGWSDILFDEKEFESLIGYSKSDLTTFNIILVRNQLKKDYLDYQYQKVKNPSSYNKKMTMSGPPQFKADGYFDKKNNFYVLLAPLFQEPFYDVNRPVYLNYGSVGTMIAHILTHVFDIELKYHGRVEPWRDELLQRHHDDITCINDQYQIYIQQHQLNATNKTAFFTLDEIYSDFSAANLAYSAYIKQTERTPESHNIQDYLPGIKYDPAQLFWIMSSTYLCDNEVNKEYKRNAEHVIDHKQRKFANPSFRVNGPKMNLHSFAQDFNCKHNYKMNQKLKCNVGI